MGTLALILEACAPNNPKDRVVHRVNEFFGWYVTSLMHDGNPLAKNRAKLRNYATLACIDQILSDEHAEVDYFLKTQDYFDDWAHSIVVGPVTFEESSTATANVVLGQSDESRHRLRVTMKLEGDWMIHRVDEVRAAP